MLEIVKHLLGKDDPKEMEILSKINHIVSFLSLALRKLNNQVYSSVCIRGPLFKSVFQLEAKDLFLKIDFFGVNVFPRPETAVANI